MSEPGGIFSSPIGRGVLLIGLIAGGAGLGFWVGQGWEGPSAQPVAGQMDCMARKHLFSTRLMDLREEVLAERAVRHQLELDLGPVGGVPSWWKDEGAMEIGRAIARDRADPIQGAKVSIQCDEDPCLLVLEGLEGAGPAISDADIFAREGRNLILAASPVGDEEGSERAWMRRRRTEVRVTRQLAAVARGAK
jgi:hypothetical protein